MSDDWLIFKGEGKPHNNIKNLPPPPNWRQFKTAAEKVKQRGETFQITEDEIRSVNAALYLRRPLLLTGKPGTGKTSLAYKVAYELNLGSVLVWHITTRSTLQQGLYGYDAIARLQDAKNGDNTGDIGNYITLGPLGTAFACGNASDDSIPQCVLLIDEIDKSDIDLPNDLLNLFEEGEFEIQELGRLKKNFPEVTVRGYDGKDYTIENGKIACKAFPFVILTSNGEREFPPAFLRRCLQLRMRDPDEAMLTNIVKAHFHDNEEIINKSEQLIKDFLKKQEKGELATDQLLNAVYLITGKNSPNEKDKNAIVEILMKHLTNTGDA